MFQSRKSLINWFAETTSIRGISFLKFADGRTEKLFWSLILLIFVSLTLYEVIRTFDIFFFHQPVFSSFSVMLNSTVALRNAKLCFSFDSSALETNFNTFNSIQEIHEFLINLPPRMNYTKTIDLPTYLTLKRLAFPKSHKALIDSTPKQLAMLTTQMLASVIRAEQIFAPIQNINANRWGLFDPIRLSIDTSASKSIEILRDYHLNRSRLLI